MDDSRDRLTCRNRCPVVAPPLDVSLPDFLTEENNANGILLLFFDTRLPTRVSYAFCTLGLRFRYASGHTGTSIPTWTISGSLHDRGQSPKYIPSIEDTILIGIRLWNVAFSEAYLELEGSDGIQ